MTKKDMPEGDENLPLVFYTGRAADGTEKYYWITSASRQIVDGKRVIVLYP